MDIYLVSQQIQWYLIRVSQCFLQPCNSQCQNQMLEREYPKLLFSINSSFSLPPVSHQIHYPVTEGWASKYRVSTAQWNSFAHKPLCASVQVCVRRKARIPAVMKGASGYKPSGVLKSEEVSDLMFFFFKNHKFTTCSLIEHRLFTLPILNLFLTVPHLQIKTSKNQLKPELCPPITSFCLYSQTLAIKLCA